MKSKRIYWSFVHLVLHVTWICATSKHYTTLASSVDESSTRDPDQLDFGILEWVDNYDGGFYSSKQELRRADPNDPTSMIGVFATERIEAGELLVRVPWDIVVKSDDVNEEQEQMSCGMIFRLAKEMQAGNESKYAPYISYLHAQKDGQLPSTWSESGQSLLLDILGGSTDQNTMLEPENSLSWIKKDWYQSCKGNPKDKVAEKAAVLAILRADDSIMIPGYDFYNHRNGKWHNADTKIEEGVSHSTYATKTIEVGEQIFISYTMCSACPGRYIGYGTAEILRDYGFVELFPQRWHVLNDQIEFDLDRSENGQLVLNWVTKPEGGAAEGAKLWLKKQIVRLQWIWNIKWQQGHFSLAKEISETEWDQLRQFHQAYLTALTAALDSLNGQALANTAASGESLASHYDDLKEVFYDSDHEELLCTFQKYDSYRFYAGVGSASHSIDVSRDYEGKDVCMDIDGQVHVCSSFRPGHYEAFVHPAASFIPTLRRVLIIGKGASFGLHEVLKYDSIQHVVVMELDIAIARESHQHMHVDPKLSDDRVEWWFGAPAENLLLFPDEYWGSFDLVLLDAPPEDTNTTLGKPMHMTSLLQTNGIVVTKSFPMREMASMFKYSARFLYDSPRRCTRTITMGSPSINFLKSPKYDHKVENFIYTFNFIKENLNFFIHDFEESVHLPELPNDLPEMEAQSGLGVLGILEGGLLDASYDIVDQAVTETLETLCFSVVNRLTMQNGHRIYFFSGGYVIYQWDDAHDYLGLDIHLASKTNQLKDIKAALIDELKLSSPSFFQLVTNGLSKPKRLYEECRAPAEPEDQSTSPIEDNVVKTMLQTAVSTLLGPRLLHVLVVCEGNLACPSADYVDSLDHVRTKHVLRTCEDGLDSEEGPEGNLSCEMNLQTWIQENLVTAQRKVGLLVLDGNLSHSSLQVLNGAFNVDVQRLEWMDSESLVVALPTGKTSTLSDMMHVFLDRFHRLAHEQTPLDKFKKSKRGFSIRTELAMSKDGIPTNLGIVSQGVEKGKSLMLGLVDKLQSHLEDVRIQNLSGGWFRNSARIVPRSFQHADYSDIPGPLTASDPIYVQLMAQLEAEDNNIDLKRIMMTVSAALRLNGLQLLAASPGVISEKTAIVEFDRGFVICTWYGEEFIDISLYMEYKDWSDEDLSLQFMMYITKSTGYNVVALDEIPRGPDTLTNYPIYPKHIVQ